MAVKEYQLFNEVIANVKLWALPKIDEAVKWTLNCCGRLRLPEPTRIADIEVGKIKRAM